ncbi:MAG: primosomal protein N', partial [bacterium]
RVHGRFKDNVALYHSGLSSGEKYDQYRRVINKEVKIVVGARSAVFTPFTNLGIIIIDEEHESSYKQDIDPRYDARIIARIRAKKHNCPVLLGSATPELSSFYKAEEGTYKLLELKQRANKQKLPNLKVVNMLDELKKGNRNLLSSLLQSKIQERIQRDEQTIILLNRRGYSSFITCRDCDESVGCHHCDVNLTYHKSNDTLRCHHCGFSQKNIKACPSCNSVNIRYVGVGTQQVVESLQEIFPNENILRMDVDTTTKKNSHEEILNTFKNRESRILVGTQMIAKGLDFPYVTLVGILSADISLKSSSYDANEKCFQLITQVAGRAGRHHLDGEVVVQAYETESYAIELAKTQDYHAFYKKDLTIRRLSNNPPFSDMITIIISSKNQRKSHQYADMVKNYLLSNTSVKVLGPAEDEILYLNDQFRYKLVIKYSKDKMLASALENIYIKTQTNNEVTISINRS